MAAIDVCSIPTPIVDLADLREIALKERVPSA
jgi:hypothetical protein